MDDSGGKRINVKVVLRTYPRDLLITDEDHQEIPFDLIIQDADTCPLIRNVESRDERLLMPSGSNQPICKSALGKENVNPSPQSTSNGPKDVAETIYISPFAERNCKKSSNFSKPSEEERNIQNIRIVLRLALANGELKVCEANAENLPTSRKLKDFENLDNTCSCSSVKRTNNPPLPLAVASMPEKDSELPDDYCTLDTCQYLPKSSAPTFAIEPRCQSIASNEQKGQLFTSQPPMMGVPSATATCTNETCSFKNVPSSAPSESKFKADCSNTNVPLEPAAPTVQPCNNNTCLQKTASTIKSKTSIPNNSGLAMHQEKGRLCKNPDCPYRTKPFKLSSKAFEENEPVLTLPNMDYEFDTQPSKASCTSRTDYEAAANITPCTIPSCQFSRTPSAPLKPNETCTNKDCPYKVKYQNLMEMKQAKSAPESEPCRNDTCEFKQTNKNKVLAGEKQSKTNTCDDDTCLSKTKSKISRMTNLQKPCTDETFKFKKEQVSTEELKQSEPCTDETCVFKKKSVIQNTSSKVETRPESCTDETCKFKNRANVKNSASNVELKPCTDETCVFKKQSNFQSSPTNLGNVKSQPCTDETCLHKNKLKSQAHSANMARSSETKPFELSTNPSNTSGVSCTEENCAYNCTGLKKIQSCDQTTCIQKIKSKSDQISVVPSKPSGPLDEQNIISSTPHSAQESLKFLKSHSSTKCPCGASKQSLEPVASTKSLAKVVTSAEPTQFKQPSTKTFTVETILTCPCGGQKVIIQNRQPSNKPLAVNFRRDRPCNAQMALAQRSKVKSLRRSTGLTSPYGEQVAAEQPSNTSEPKTSAPIKQEKPGAKSITSCPCDPSTVQSKAEDIAQPPHIKFSSKLLVGRSATEISSSGVQGQPLLVSQRSSKSATAPCPCDEKVEQQVNTQQSLAKVRGSRRASFCSCASEPMCRAKEGEPIPSIYHFKLPFGALKSIPGDPPTAEKESLTPIYCSSPDNLRPTCTIDTCPFVSHIKEQPLLEPSPCPCHFLSNPPRSARQYDSSHHYCPCIKPDETNMKDDDLQDRTKCTQATCKPICCQGLFIPFHDEPPKPCSAFSSAGLTGNSTNK